MLVSRPHSLFSTRIKHFCLLDSLIIHPSPFLEVHRLPSGQILPPANQVCQPKIMLGFGPFKTKGLIWQFSILCPRESLRTNGRDKETTTDMFQELTRCYLELFAGFHSRASFWASAICAGVIFSARLSRNFLASFSPFAIARVNHICAWT